MAADGGDRDPDDDVEDLAGLSAAPVSESFAPLLREALSASIAPLAPGDRISDRYEVVRLLGAGGMGEVYLARDQVLSRDVAIKLHLAAAGAGRTHREAISMAQLTHPNVVTVFDVGRHGDRVFVAMEYVPGQTLRAWLATKRTWRDVLSMMLPLGDGLAAAHRAGLIHRDVKPENILVDVEGRARLADFGLARNTTSHPGTTASPEVMGTQDTMTLGGAGGTVAYMPPEQLVGGDVDARCDQFAYCVTMWEAWFGARPFNGSTVAEQRALIEKQSFAPFDTTVPWRVLRVVERGLAAKAADRFPTMEGLLAALRKATRRRGAIYAGVGAGAVALGAVVTVTQLGGRGEEPCRAGEASLERGWPAANVTALVAALDEQKPPAELRERVASAIEAWRTRFRESANAVCKAERRGEWRVQLGAAAGFCLDVSARTAGMLLDVGEARKPFTLVERALLLPELADCTDVVALTAAPPPPAFVIERTRVVEARARLADADLSLVLDGVARATSSLEAASVGDLSVQAEQTYVRGRIALERTQIADGEKLLSDAYYLARSRADGALSLRALTALLGSVALTRSATDEAAPWMRTILADADRERSIHPREAASAYIAVARAAGTEDRWADALGYVGQALPLLASGDSLQRSEALSARAAALIGLGRNDEALEGYRDAAKMVARLVGTSHPRYAAALSDHAGALLVLVRDAEAAKLAEEAYQVLRSSSNASGVDVASTQLNLGASLLFSNETRAMELLETARKNFVAALGPNHLDVALVDSNLAIGYNIRGEPVRAIEMLESALSIQEKALGPQHANVITSLYNLAVAQRTHGDLADARATIDRCVAAMAATTRGSARHAIGIAQSAMIANLERDFARGERDARVAIGMLKDEEQLAWPRLELGRALIGENRRADARVPIEAALAFYQKHATDHAERLKEATELLAETKR